MRPENLLRAPNEPSSFKNKLKTIQPQTFDVFDSPYVFTIVEIQQFFLFLDCIEGGVFTFVL